jgi:hypothetical protein
MATDDNLQPNAEVAHFILQQSQTYLDAQLRIALASDMRAIRMIGVYTGLATAVGAAILAYWDRFEQDISVPLAGLVAAIFFIVAAACCMRSATPTAFYVAGTEPTGLWQFANEHNFADLVKGESHNYQERLNHNDRLLKKNAHWFLAAAWIGLLGPFAGILAWAAVSFGGRGAATLTRLICHAAFDPTLPP